MRFFVFLCFLSITVIAQNNKRLDSISESFKRLSEKEQVERIIAIPYDVAVSDIMLFERLVDSSIATSKRLKDTLLLAHSLRQKALALHFSSKTDEAVATTLKVITLFEHLKMSPEIGDNYVDLGWKLKRTHYPKAFQYIKKGIGYLEKESSGNQLDKAYDHLGVLFGMKKNWDSSAYYHKKSLKIKKRRNDSIGIPFGYVHLAYVDLKNKRFNNSKKYLDSAYHIRDFRKDIYGIAETYLYYGDLYYEQNDFNKAIDYFDKGLNLSSKNEYYPLTKYAVEYLHKSYYALDKPKEALAYHLLYTKMKDSVLNVQTNERINRLEIEFQTEKKEKEILSQRADIAEQELSISKKNNYILGLATLAILLLLLGYLVYSQQRLKNRQLQKENQLKDALLQIETQSKLQEQRLRISRDLHDNIGAQLTFIISSLDNLKYAFQLPDKLGNKLKGISEFTSVTISELRDTIWAMNKKRITLEDLQTRLSNLIEKVDVANLSVSLNFDDTLNVEHEFTSVQGMNIYRIVQEALNNAIKYADASTIRIGVCIIDDKYR